MVLSRILDWPRPSGWLAGASTGRSFSQAFGRRLPRLPAGGVTVTQHKSQQVYVMGAVGKPGPYALQRQTTLLEALSAAGGPTPDAGFEVILTHAADKRALPSSTSKVSAAANGQPACGCRSNN